MPDLSQARVGVIGAAACSIPGFPGGGTHDRHTLRAPSDQLRLEAKGVETVFSRMAPSPRAGDALPGQHLGDAFWGALADRLGGGSLQERSPRDMVVPDQFIDRTRDRPPVFSATAAWPISLADPFCPI